MRFQIMRTKHKAYVRMYINVALTIVVDCRIAFKLHQMCLTIFI